MSILHAQRWKLPSKGIMRLSSYIIAMSFKARIDRSILSAQRNPKIPSMARRPLFTSASLPCAFFSSERFLEKPNGSYKSRAKLNFHGRVEEGVTFLAYIAWCGKDFPESLSTHPRSPRRQLG